MNELAPPWTEAQRLEALESYGILDTPSEPAFDDIAKLAALTCDAPIALVSLVGKERQWFKSELGIGIPEFAMDVRTVISGGKTIRGVIEGDATPQEFIPRLLEMHARGEFPVDRMMRQYPFEAIETAVADAHSGATIKPILIF